VHFAIFGAWGADSAAWRLLRDLGAGQNGPRLDRQGHADGRLGDLPGPLRGPPPPTEQRSTPPVTENDDCSESAKRLTGCRP